MANIHRAEQLCFLIIGEEEQCFGNIAFGNTHASFDALRAPVLKRKPFRVCGRDGHDALCAPVFEIGFILRFCDLLG